ncbi:hypothetical protein TNCV_400981 [Trichonephila clavipes]|nr:hypothetical protein TNCV_400981 [Trichonephila clavipes]
MQRWFQNIDDGRIVAARIEGRFNLVTFRSENEYLSHHAKTIVIAWRLLLVYIDMIPPHCTLASDSANRRTNDTIVVASVCEQLRNLDCNGFCGLRHSCVMAFVSCVIRAEWLVGSIIRA